MRGQYIHIYMRDNFIISVIACLVYIWSKGMAGLLGKPLVTGFGRVN